MKFEDKYFARFDFTKIQIEKNYRNALKDIGIAMELANSKGLPLPLSALGHHLWKAAKHYAKDGASISEMARWVEHTTGIEITPGSDR